MNLDFDPSKNPRFAAALSAGEKMFGFSQHSLLKKVSEYGRLLHTMITGEGGNVSQAGSVVVPQQAQAASQNYQTPIITSSGASAPATASGALPPGVFGPTAIPSLPGVLGAIPTNPAQPSTSAGAPVGKVMPAGWVKPKF